MSIQQYRNLNQDIQAEQVRIENIPFGTISKERHSHLSKIFKHDPFMLPNKLYSPVLTIIKNGGIQTRFAEEIPVIYEHALSINMNHSQTVIFDFVLRMYQNNQLSGDFCNCNCPVCETQIGFKRCNQIEGFSTFFELGSSLCTFACPRCISFSPLKIALLLCSLGNLYCPNHLIMNSPVQYIIDKYSRLKQITEDIFFEGLFMRIIGHNDFPRRSFPYSFITSNASTADDWNSVSFGEGSWTSVAENITFRFREHFLYPVVFPSTPTLSAGMGESSSNNFLGLKRRLNDIQIAINLEDERFMNDDLNEDIDLNENWN